MIEAAKHSAPGEETHYIGIDRFEGREPSDGPGLTLKAAHQILGGKATRVQLLPGDPSKTLSRSANSLGKIDLLIVPEELESAEAARVWFVPRMLHERSLCSSSGSWPTGKRRSGSSPAKRSIGPPPPALAGRHKQSGGTSCAIGWHALSLSEGRGAAPKSHALRLRLRACHPTASF